MATYDTKVGVFETGERDAQGGAYKDVRFLALRNRKALEYQVRDGVSIIGDRAFYDDFGLETVVLPQGLKAIGQSAFAGCKKLTNVNIPEGVEVIKEAAFRDCESLTELTLPTTLLEVGKRAFGPALKRLVVLSENTSFDFAAFKQVKELEEILVPASVVGKYAVFFKVMGITARIAELAEDAEDACTSVETDAMEEEKDENPISAEFTEEDAVEQNIVKALIKYYVEGEIYGKVVFVYNGQYCVDQDNYGDIDFDNVRNYTEDDLNPDICYELGVDADKPIADCEQEIIEAYLSALEDEDELQYLDDPSSTYLEYEGAENATPDEMQEDDDEEENHMNFFEFVSKLAIAYDYYLEEDYDEDSEDYQSNRLELRTMGDEELERYLDYVTWYGGIPEEAVWEMVDYDGDLEREDPKQLKNEQEGMEILKQYPEAFVKAAHMMFCEEEGCDCEEAIYGVGGYFWWGDEDDLEEEFFVDAIEFNQEEEE